MKLSDVARDSRAFILTWDDQQVAEYPYIWLRDNDPDELHPQTRERIFNLSSVDLDIAPVSEKLENGSLVLTWPNKTEASVYPLDWLYAHQPGRHRTDASRVERTLWNRDELSAIPRCDASACLRDSDELAKALLRLKQYGLIIVADLEDSPTAGEVFGSRIGFKRETNFGTMFEVRSVPEPNNLAYTSSALPLHTDLPNQETVPGYQFLHSVANTASGGESIFADGFRICADLRTSAPEDFEILCRKPMPYRFHDDSCDIRQRRPTISFDSEGEFSAFVFNAHIADIPDFPAAELYDYYRAYRNLMIMMRDPHYSVSHFLVPGEMVVFDNRRILHGRAAFDAESGQRHFRGYYVEHNEVDSCIRMLAGQ